MAVGFLGLFLAKPSCRRNSLLNIYGAFQGVAECPCLHVYVFTEHHN